MVVGCIIAGGKGERLGAGIPKQFLEVLGKPIIVYTMECFDACEGIEAFDVVCLAGYEDMIYEYKEQYHIQKLRKVITGGDTFGESVRNGVYALEDHCKSDDVFLLHMSISPLVSDEILCDAIDVCKKYGNAFSAVPSYMCMCEATGEGFSEKFLNRELIYGLMTPQAVRYGKILELYRNAEAKGYDLNARTHLSTLLLDMGERIYFSKSSSVNIKITTMDDVDLLNALLSIKTRRGLDAYKI